MERIDLRLISNPDQDQAAAKKELAEQLATFDAAEAQCFNASSRRGREDRQRLLAVIEAGFGDFKGFNQDVCNVFDHGLPRRPSLSGAIALAMQQRRSSSILAVDPVVEAATKQKAQGRERQEWTIVNKLTMPHRSCK